MLPPDIRAASGSEFFLFQQDSAPSHRAKDSVALLEQETPDFIIHTLWPHNWAFTRHDRRTDRSVGPTSQMKRLHVPIVGPPGRPDPGYVRLVGLTSRTDLSDRL